MQLKRLTLPLIDVKFLGDGPDSAEYGTFEGYASVYGNVDLDNEVVDRGAFTKTISERGARVKLLLQHDTNRPIGIGRVADTEVGLKVYGKLALSTDDGRNAYGLMREGVLDQFSIGFEVVKSKRAGKVLHLTELKLWEVSLVTFPANPAAMVQTVKSAASEAAAEARRAVSLAHALAALHIDIRTGGEQLTDADREVLRDAIHSIDALLKPAAAPDPKPSTPEPGAADPAESQPEASLDEDVLHSLRSLANEMTAAAGAAV